MRHRRIPARFRTLGRFTRGIIRVNDGMDRKEAKRIARLSYWRCIGQPWLG